MLRFGRFSRKDCDWWLKCVENRFVIFHFEELFVRNYIFGFMVCATRGEKVTPSVIARTYRILTRFYVRCIYLKIFVIVYKNTYFPVSHVPWQLFFQIETLKFLLQNRVSRTEMKLSVLNLARKKPFSFNEWHLNRRTGTFATQYIKI